MKNKTALAQLIEWLESPSLGIPTYDEIVGKIRELKLAEIRQIMDGFTEGTYRQETATEYFERTFES